MRIHFGDKLFALIVVTLVLLGTAIFLSASLGLLARQNADIAHLATTQLVLGPIPGIGVLVVLRFLKPEHLQKLILPLYILSLHR